ncbi:MAG: hypothetical protein ABIY47_06270 [Opitutaceae bacterium]
MIQRLKILLLGLATGSAFAMTDPISDQEILKVPTEQRLTAIMAAAQREGWARQVAPLRAAAERAYRRDDLEMADAWFNIYRWASIWSSNDNDFIDRWKVAVQTAQVAHANMPRTPPGRRLPLGFLLLPELQFWLLSNQAFSREIFSLITPVDYLPAVFRILNELHFDNPAKFKAYTSLALAIALVYDVPPPPKWPHGQVSTDVLARKWPNPLDAFTWWTKQDQLGLTYYRLAELGAEELRFVVDAPASFPELEWSQQAVEHPLASLGKAYTMVRYDIERVQRNELMWSAATYTLQDILGSGGICTDQAYFASNVGKARGVPTLLFRGQGINARHAWFGFLDSTGKWQLDVGRYAEQRFVTGYVIDPQTWREISDHALKFLADHFLKEPAYLRSRVHAEFASDFLFRGNLVAAGSAALKAVKLEPRNFVAWETMVSVEKTLGFGTKTREGTLREAAAALQGYPDLEASYSARLTESMRARGDHSAADVEQARITLKNQENRGDISLGQIRTALVQSFSTQALSQQLISYHGLLAGPGKGAGIGFFDQVVVVFVEHLVQIQELDEAAKAVELARQTLKVEPNTQLARDFDELSRRVVAAH